MKFLQFHYDSRASDIDPSKYTACIPLILNRIMECKLETPPQLINTAHNVLFLIIILSFGEYKDSYTRGSACEGEIGVGR